MPEIEGAVPGPAGGLRLFVGDVGDGGEIGSLDRPGAAALSATAPKLAPGAEFDLPEAAAAHVKVRRLQPGDAVRLFDGESGVDWPAAVQAIGRHAVRVQVGGEPVAAVAAELPLAVTLAFSMPANDRVDALVEKATELGAAALWPLMSERSVLRLQGERAARRRAHWQGVAAAACEQCGRARVPRVHPVQALASWWTPGSAPRDPSTARWVLSTAADAPPVAQVAGPALANLPAGGAVMVLSGPEGGLAPAELEAAAAAGFTAVSLGPRILRADTAPLAVLAWLGIASAQRPGLKAGA